MLKVQQVEWPEFFVVVCLFFEVNSEKFPGAKILR